MPADDLSTLEIPPPGGTVGLHESKRTVCEPGGRSLLVVVLMNPPSESSGSRTRNAVAVAGALLGHTHVRIVNLCRLPTKSVVELAASSLSDWNRARPDIVEAFGQPNAVLTAWGVSPLRGAAQRHFESQVRWLCRVGLETGLDRVWTVGGRPRHPSRWHQFVADKHGRTEGGNFPERLNQVLEQIPLHGLEPRGLPKLWAE